MFGFSPIGESPIGSAQSYEVGTASAQFSVTTDSPVFSGGASTSSSAIFNVLIDDAIFAGGAIVSGAPNEASFSVTTDDAVFSGSAYVLTPATASFNVTTDSAVASFSAAVAAIVSFSATTADAVFYGKARSANAEDFIRAPSGNGPTVIRPGGYRPSNTGGRRY